MFLASAYVVVNHTVLIHEKQSWLNEKAWYTGDAMEDVCNMGLGFQPWSINFIWNTEAAIKYFTQIGFACKGFPVAKMTAVVLFSEICSFMVLVGYHSKLIKQMATCLEFVYWFLSYSPIISNVLWNNTLQAAMAMVCS